MRTPTAGDKIRARSSSPSFTIGGRNFYSKGKCEDGTRVYVHLAKAEDAPSHYHVSTPAHNGYRLFWLFVTLVAAIVIAINEQAPGLIQQWLGI